MEDYLFNFGDEPNLPVKKSDLPAAPEEIKEIRHALDQARIFEQVERKQMVVRAIGRDVASLREILGSEVKTVIYRIFDEIADGRTKSTSSAWDDRDEETWIDKL